MCSQKPGVKSARHDNENEDVERVKPKKGRRARHRSFLLLCYIFIYIYILLYTYLFIYFLFIYCTSQKTRDFSHFWFTSMCHVVRTVRQSFIFPKHSQTDVTRSRFNNKTFTSQQELTQSGKVKIVVAQKLFG